MTRDLWYLWKAQQDIRYSVRTILHPFDPDQRLGVELRLDRNGEMYLTELYRDRRRLDARSRELYGLLAAKGWLGHDGRG